MRNKKLLYRALPEPCCLRAQHQSERAQEQKHTPRRAFATRCNQQQAATNKAALSDRHDLKVALISFHLRLKKSPKNSCENINYSKTI